MTYANLSISWVFCSPFVVLVVFFAFSQTNDNNKLHSRDLDELKYEVQPVDVDALVQIMKET